MSIYFIGNKKAQKFFFSNVDKFSNSTKQEIKCSNDRRISSYEIIPGTLIFCCKRHNTNSKFSAKTIYYLNYCTTFKEIKYLAHNSGVNSSRIECEIEKIQNGTSVPYVTEIPPNNRLMDTLRNCRIRKYRMLVMMIENEFFVNANEDVNSNHYSFLWEINNYMLRRFKALVSKLTKIKTKKWQIAITFENQTHILSGKKMNYADPFIFCNSPDEITVFYEEWEENSKGTIGATTINNSKSSRTSFSNIIDEEFHMSFPYIFSDAKFLYMIPQTNTGNKLMIYKNINFPDKWEIFNAIELPFRLVDTICVYNDNCWYLIGTTSDPDFTYRSNRAYIFKSENLDSSNWRMVGTEPLIWSDFGGRAGGFFCLEHPGRFVRVGQIGGSDRYGFSINFMELIFQNKEKIALVGLLNHHNKNLSNLHHFDYNFVSQALAFDYKI